MRRIDNPKAVIHASTEAHSYLKLLQKIEVFKHMIDGYMFAAAYSIKNNLDINTSPLEKPHEVARINVIDDNVRLALEAGIYTIRKRNNQTQPENNKELLDILSQYAEVGLKALKQRWEGKVSLQIQDDILKIINFA
ncbi:MAG: hypothetical protein Kow0049_14950 [Stanieria sp.]